MNYQKHYNSLIETRRNRVLDPTQYYEKHHIMPKCLNGSNNPRNLIYLTAKEHFVAHWLLVKEAFKNGTKNEQHKLSNAFHYMCYGTNQQEKHFTGRQYEIARKLHSKTMQGENNPMYGKTGSSNPMYDKTHTEETKNKMSLARTNRTGKDSPFYGNYHTEEIKKKLSEERKDKKHKQVTCPFCGKTGGQNGMVRYHFDNCKYKEN